jgi:hypothetical protein
MAHKDQLARYLPLDFGAAVPQVQMTKGENYYECKEAYW